MTVTDTNDAPIATRRLEAARARAQAMGLTGAKTGLGAAQSRDPLRLALAAALAPLTAAALYLALRDPLALLLAGPLSLALCATAPATRHYFIAFSPRNGFPRNLPAFVRWAALYAGGMLVMIALPPTLSVQARAGTWLFLATLLMLLPILKARMRAQKVWRGPDA